jgi:hypothetical protein
MSGVRKADLRQGFALPAMWCTEAFNRVTESEVAWSLRETPETDWNTCLFVITIGHDHQCFLLGLESLNKQ